MSVSKLRFIGLLLLSTLFQVHCIGQELPWSHYSSKNGLTSNCVYDICSTPDGKMWFATSNGVTVFDGTHFTSFGPENGLPDPEVFKITTDDFGRPWFSTYSGDLYYLEDQKVKAFFEESPEERIPNLSFKNVLSLAVYGDSVLLGYNSGEHLMVGKSGHHQMVDADTGRQHIFYSITRAGKTVFGINELPKYSMVLLRKVEGQAWQRILLSGHEHDHMFGCFALELDNGKLLFANHKSLYLIDSMGEIETSRTDFNKPIIRLFEDNEGSIWVCTKSGGAFKIDIENGLSVQSTFLEDLSVTAIHQDFEGGYWFSTLESGVYYSPFVDVTYHEVQEVGLAGTVTCMDALGNDLVLGTSSEILGRYRTSLGKLELVKTGFGTVNDLVVAGSSAFVAGAKGIFRLDSMNRLIQLNEMFMKDLYWQDGELTGMNSSLFAINLYDDSYKVLRDYHCRQIDFVVENPNRFWVACLDKLTLAELEDGNWQIRDIIEGRVNELKLEGTLLYASTVDGGLCIINTSTLEQQWINRSNGLPSSLCYSSLMASDGSLWVANHAGVSRMVLGDEGWQLAKNYNQFDGIFRYASRDMVEVNETVWITDEKGVWSIPLKNAHKNVEAPLFLELKGKVLNGRDVVDSSLRRLSHKVNDVQFHFLAAAFRNAGEMAYRYRLNGLDSNYHTTRENEVFYASLSPGDYQFEVQALNSDGLWSVSKTLGFSIPIPFWKRDWFTSAVVLLLLFMSVGALLIRQNMIKRKQNVQMALANYEQKAVAAQMNPHFIYNILNSAQYYINNNGADTANDYLARVAFLMRKILHNSNHSFVTVEEELTVIRSYLSLEKERFQQKFEYKIDVDSALDTSGVFIPSMVIQPHVENAIWHGLMRSKKPERLLTVRLNLQENLLIWQVEDNGLGREKAQQSEQDHESTGVGLTKKRLAALSVKTKNTYSQEIQDLYEENGEPAGTLIIIKMHALENA